jgi:hypothetical protein
MNRLTKSISNISVRFYLLVTLHKFPRDIKIRERIAMARRKKTILALAVTMLLGSLLWFMPVQNVAAAAPLEVQLISDQLHAVAGGEISYHIIYHNVENKKMSKVWLKIKLQEGLEPDIADGAEWDGTTRTLKWNLKDIDTNGADVIHFNLKVKENVKMEQIFELSCIVEVDGLTLSESGKVKVKVGKEVHQPVFNGYPDGLFHPTWNLTRAETAAVISRVKNLQEEPSANLYSDVPKEHWAYHYINKVSKAGYMNGSNGTFRPDDPISRGEFVELILRLRGIGPVPLAGFEDTIGHWAHQSIATAKALKFIDGFPGSKFLPNQYIERQSAAKLLSIALYRGQLKDGEQTVIQHWPDVKREDWSFGWIAETSMVAHESENQGKWIERLIRYLPDETEPF